MNSRHWQPAMTLLLAGGVFVSDLTLPDVIAAEFLYVPLMLLTSGLSNRQ